jgi:hypothetical protein
VSCPICGKRKPKRFCPAKGGKICAICCGTEREVTIDCPSDCLHLIASRRWDAEHRKPIPPEQWPFPDVLASEHALAEHKTIFFGLGWVTLEFAQQEPALRDADALEALDALAKTYRTLTSGILYEQPPPGGLARELYARLAQALDDFKKEEAREGGGLSVLKDSEIFLHILFLLRIVFAETNGRPRSRAAFDYLRAKFPRAAVEEIAGRGPRIITP